VAAEAGWHSLASGSRDCTVDYGMLAGQREHGNRLSGVRSNWSRTVLSPASSVGDGTAMSYWDIHQLRAELEEPKSKSP